MIQEKDKKLLKEMSKAISYYLKAASYLSDETFNELAKHKGLYWIELEDQREILEKLANQEDTEDKKKEKGEENIENTEDEVKEEIESEESAEGTEDEGKEEKENAESTEYTEDEEKEEKVSAESTEYAEDEGKEEKVSAESTEYAEDKVKEERESAESIEDAEDEGKEEKENAEAAKNAWESESIKNTENAGRENGPVMLYDSMVKYLKKQKLIEHQWVRVYSVKYPMQDNRNFEIKYYEYKDQYAAHKNYISFGDAVKSYSIRKVKDEVVGDTEVCFNYILNLKSPLGLE